MVNTLGIHLTIPNPADFMFVLKPAAENDIPIILRFIKEIADYEKLSHTVTATHEAIRESVFVQQRAHVLIAFKDNVPAGYAVYFFNFSTFTGRAGLYLEDIYVHPDFRRQKLASIFFSRLAQIAIQNKCPRFEWAVLDWNQGARDFYKQIGAQEGHEWILNRLEGQALESLAAKNKIN